MKCVYIVLLHSLQNGTTPLIAASHKGHRDIVEVLLNHGAEVDLPNKVSVCVSCSYLNFHACSLILQAICLVVTIPLDSSCRATAMCSVEHNEFSVYFLTLY